MTGYVARWSSPHLRINGTFTLISCAIGKNLHTESFFFPNVCAFNKQKEEEKDQVCPRAAKMGHKSTDIF